MTIGKTNRKVCLGETPRPAHETSATRKVRCGNATKRKTLPQKLSGLSSGDVLLSHDLSSHYHRGCSVSLPCSEWERVVPLRDDHQKSAPQFEADFWCVIRDRLHRYNGLLCNLCDAFHLF